MGCGGWVGDRISDVGDSISDAVSDVGDSISDAVSDVGDFVGDVATDVWNDVLEPVYDTTLDLTHEVTEFGLDVFDTAFEAVGVSGAVDFFYDLNEGALAVGKGIGDGNWDAIKAGAMIAVAVVVTIVTWNPYSLANAIGSMTALTQAGAYTLIAIQYASIIYSVYGIAIPLSIIGKYAKNMNGLLAEVQRIKDSMILAFTNMWINGSMNLWRAGGILYDAPRAGDMKFDVMGHLETSKFLMLQDRNNTQWSKQINGRYGELHGKTYKNMAGNPFFSITSMV